MEPGEVVRFFRKRNHLTQEELGEVLGVKKSAIQKYENGDVALRIDTLRKLCVYFHVVPWVFIFPDDFGVHIPPSSYQTDKGLYTFDYGENGLLDFTQIYASLNIEARLKIKEHAEDLAKIPEYKNTLYSYTKK